VSIPVRNIYYLLLYSWGHIQPGVMQAVGRDESPDLPNLLAKILLDGVQQILRRGLDRGYVTETEDTRSPRGKILLNEIVKRQTLLRGAAVCEFDELTSDILHNRILKRTLLKLAASSDVKRHLRRDLAGSAKRMPQVKTVPLNAGIFHRVQLSRNTAQYAFLMRVCELIFHTQIPDEKGTGGRFHDLFDDETRMAHIFEDFLRNFYRMELDGFTSGAEIMPWAAKSSSDEDMALLPVMKTDITLRGRNRTIIADAKYYKEALAGGRYSSKLRSAHLYQLSTYLAHEALRAPETVLSGMLIYPAVGQRMRHQYDLLGHSVMIASVDLSAEWPEIHDELLGLVST
jgi:5-methylcytosine-specific restriction enzyme subunit McrC